jgi:cytochrome oxidase Cu insertion factor (SCO1/SenC/PrrC family)
LIQWIIGAFLILPLIGLAAVFLAGRHSSEIRRNETLPVYGTAADFSLTEQNGGILTRRDLLNSVWVADLIFTHCAGQCPRMTMAMSKLQKKLPAEVLFLSFSVDPLRDTPAVLLEYADTYRAEKGRWFFLNE